MLSKLKIHCKYKDNGCKKILDYDKLEIHEEHECEFLLRPCPEKKSGCKVMLKKNELEKHIREECQFSRTECMYCNEKFPRAVLREHLFNC